MMRVADEDLQPVCQGNHFDFDTGECKLFVKDEKEHLHQCSKYPYCALKVGEPVLRILVEEVKK